MASHNKKSFDFEAALEELEAIVGAMESGRMPLDEALTRFARGSELLKACQDTLRAAEKRIEGLEESLLDPTDTSAEGNDDSA